MTEKEAAIKLAALLNEIEEAGIAVTIEPYYTNGYHLSVGAGGLYLSEPPCDGEPWEMREE